MAKAKAAPENEQSKTKAQAIRDALAVDPNAMPKDLADKLSEEGWNVKAKDVSQAKFLLGKTKQKSGKKAGSKPVKAAAAAASAADAPADLVSVAALQKAKKLIQELGGVKEAKQALAALAQLLD
jgi:hypothetical protein